MADLSARQVVRLVLIVVAVAISLYLLYLLRRPIGWLLAALFLTIALSGPVNALAMRMRRGFAITLVYFGLILVPFLLAALIVPPLVGEATELADNAPQYARDLTDFVEKNDRLQNLNKDYDLTSKLQEQAGKLPAKLGDAAGTVRDVGLGIVSSIFALVTILILAAFMLGSGRRWVNHGLHQLPLERGEQLRRVLDRSSRAVASYVAGAIAQATFAGLLSFLVLKLLGVPFAAPLAVLIFFLDLIPLVGATIGAVLVGVVTLFENFPTATIVWVVFSIVYQQLENNLVQPQIQKRAVNVHPFVIIVAVLFGANLLGVLGAIVAVPVAATVQIAVREYSLVRRLLRPELGATIETAPAGTPPSSVSGA
ncbi:MAG: AI-2E family transporter [Thermoleophilaceae bacterium]|nr:AI-2E family transporter [Thermoleophilaceae bacterium]